MTTFIPFRPTALAPFQFQAVLDGTIYNCSVPWNAFRQGWYLTINNQDGTPVVTLPNVASPPDSHISLTAGYFATPLIFREATQTFEVG